MEFKIGQALRFDLGFLMDQMGIILNVYEDAFELAVVGQPAPLTIKWDDMGDVYATNAEMLYQRWCEVDSLRRVGDELHDMYRGIRDEVKSLDICPAPSLAIPLGGDLSTVSSSRIQMMASQLQKPVVTSVSPYDALASQNNPRPRLKVAHMTSISITRGVDGDVLNSKYYPDNFLNSALFCKESAEGSGKSDFDPLRNLHTSAEMEYAKHLPEDTFDTTSLKALYPRDDDENFEEYELGN